MRIGNANVASTELETVLKRKSRMKTHLDSFGIRHFHNLSPKDKLDICKIKGFICGTTSCNGRYANDEHVLRLSRAFPPKSGGGLCVRFPFNFGAIGVFLDFSRQHRKVTYTAQNQNYNEIHLFLVDEKQNTFVSSRACGSVPLANISGNERHLSFSCNVITEALKLFKLIQNESAGIYRNQQLSRRIPFKFLSCCLVSLL